MSQRHLLRGGAAPGEPSDVGALDAERARQGGGVVGHVDDREAVGHHGRAARAPRIEGREPVAVGEAVELEGPRLGRVAEAGEQDHVGSFAALVDPELDVAGGDHALERGRSDRGVGHARQA